MKARRGDIIFLCVVLAIVIVLALAHPQQSPPSTYSSYDTGPNGYRAVYEVMRRESVSVGRLEKALGTLHAFSGTLLLSPGGVAPDATRLKRLVESGVDLVVLGNVLGAERNVLEVPKMAPISAAYDARGVAGSSLTQGVARVSASFAEAFNVNAKRHVTQLLAVRGRPVAIAYRIGRGEVIAIASPGVFSNSLLTHDENARFAYDVLSAKAPLLFDESLHGYASGDSMWSVLPASVHDAVWIAFCALALGVFGGLFRSAPPIALAPLRLRDSSAYVTSMAALLRRAHAGSAAIERFAQEAQRLARLRPNAARRSEVAAALAQLETMRTDTPPNERELLAAANLMMRVRKELGVAM